MLLQRKTISRIWLHDVRLSSFILRGVFIPSKIKYLARIVKNLLLYIICFSIKLSNGSFAPIFKIIKLFFLFDYFRLIFLRHRLRECRKISKNGLAFVPRGFYTSQHKQVTNTPTIFANIMTLHRLIVSAYYFYVSRTWKLRGWINISVRYSGKVTTKCGTLKQRPVSKRTQYVSLSTILFTACRNCK